MPMPAALSGESYADSALIGHGARLDALLNELMRRVPELEAAAVVTADGLPMSSALPPGMDEDRVAAMSAALLSLGERAAEGLGRGELSQVHIQGEAEVSGCSQPAMTPSWWGSPPQARRPGSCCTSCAARPRRSVPHWRPMNSLNSPSGPRRRRWTLQWTLLRSRTTRPLLPLRFLLLVPRRSPPP